MQQYMDGTTSSSLYELKLGRQKFAGETHAYSVAWADDEIEEMLENCDKIIFNSIGQLQRYAEQSQGKVRGLRVNPQVSSSDYLLADPARPFSRLGEWDPEKIEKVIEQISGFMFHNNCENGDFGLFDKMLSHIEERFGHLLHKVQWVSLGGGIHFTGEDYALDAFCARLKAFSEKYGVQVYGARRSSHHPERLAGSHRSRHPVQRQAPGRGRQLHRSAHARPVDLSPQRQDGPNNGEHTYMVCGKSCLAGDIFGEYQFDKPLAIGDRLSFVDAAGYTMVKKNWFNGLKMPAIVVKQLDGSVEVVREFGFEDYVSSLS